VEVLVMNILGIETSCDETACAVVKDGREVLANVVYTQIPLHQPYGGVVPEVASRAHIEKIHGVVQEAMKVGVPIDAVAVTYGPGLASSLLVGLNAAKGLALSLDVPLIGVNHIEAHLHTPFLYDSGETPSAAAPEDCCPALGLAVSGGNTVWIDMPEYGKYEVIGETLDDAAGEAFDKAAKLLGLGYPGGLKIDRISAAYLATSHDRRTANLDLIPFPKGRPRDGVTALAGLPAELCVSFSGLKTALLRHVQRNPDLQNPDPALQDADPSQIDPNSHLACVIASYQEAIVQAVADRTRTALRRRDYKAFVLGGGVSLNSRLRAVLSEVASEARIPLLMAKPRYCGDNGAMIAGLAYTRRNISGGAALAVDVAPSLEVG
jgi:N6-L-threonylcarbamoyladenine synthase